MKILIVIPPYVIAPADTIIPFYIHNNAILPHKAMLPTGALMMATEFRNRGHEVQVLDLVFEKDWEKIIYSQIKTPPDLLLISFHTPRNYGSCHVVFSKIVNFLGKKPYTVLGGNACTQIGIQYFIHKSELFPVDAVIRGFGHDDRVISALVQRRQGDILPQEKIPELPIPSVDLLPKTTLAQYLKYSGGRYPMYGFGMGCSWSCSYCSAKMGKPFGERQEEAVLKELQLANNLGYKEIWCVDNLILANPERALDFDSEVSRLDMTWKGMTRSEIVANLPTNFLHQLSALQEVAIGVETSSAEILNRLSRNSRQETLTSACQTINSARIRSNAFVMLDLPGSDENDFWRLFEHLQTINPSTISWSFFNPTVREAAARRINFEKLGFYGWPLDCSTTPATRVVQQAMILSGTWWDKWTVKRDDPYFETKTELGVYFHEGRILQEKSARDAAGDLWCVWQIEEGG